MMGCGLCALGLCMIDVFVFEVLDECVDFLGYFG